MPCLPKDCTARQIGEEARKLVYYKISSINWEFHEYTGTDHGIDCVLELIENDEYHNKKIEGQIKGTQKAIKMVTKNAFSYSMEKRTINYGLGSSNAFVLFLVDVINETVYYLPIQDYFIANSKEFDRLENDNETMTIHIPCDNTVCDEDFDLQEIAKSIYVGGATRNLHKAN